VTLPVRVRRRAELDLDEAYAWYESRAEGLGEAFLRAVDACLARIARHPEAFRCTMTSTATTLTEITGCRNSVGSTVNFSALCSGKTCYVTAIQWFSSIISTTANNMLLRTGSGTNCATGTTDVYRGYSAPAFTGNIVDFPDATPLQLPFGNYLCFIHPGAGTRFVNLQGYVAP